MAINIICHTVEYKIWATDDLQQSEEYLSAADSWINLAQVKIEDAEDKLTAVTEQYQSIQA